MEIYFSHAQMMAKFACMILIIVQESVCLASKRLSSQLMLLRILSIVWLLEQHLDSVYITQWTEMSWSELLYLCKTFKLSILNSRLEIKSSLFCLITRKDHISEFTILKLLLGETKMEKKRLLDLRITLLHKLHGVHSINHYM